MNKLDILNSYKESENGFYKILKCWESQGSQKALKSTSYYGKDLIYHVTAKCNDSLLSSSLVLCKNEFIGKYDWLNASIVDTTEGYISFIDGIIDHNIVCIISGSIFDETYDTKESVDLGDFSPFENADTSETIISDSDYELCLSCLGYPFITDDELEYDKSHIINLAIKPALEEYFKWFPRVEIQTFPITSAQAVTQQFPEDAYDIVHFDVQQGGASLGTGAITNTLWRSFEDGFYGAMNTGAITGTFFGNSAPKTQTSGIGTYITSRAATQAMINYNTRTDFRKYRKNGIDYVDFYSTKGGIAEVHWAMKTHNFNDIEFSQRQNVIDYCSANVKLLFANLRKQVKTDIPGAYDYGTWVAEATTAKDNIRKEWMSITKCEGILRGSL